MYIKRSVIISRCICLAAMYLVQISGGQRAGEAQHHTRRHIQPFFTEESGVEVSLMSKPREGGKLHAVGGGQRPGESVQYQLSRSHRGEGLRATHLQHFHLSDQVTQEQVLVSELQRGIEADI